MESEKKKWDGRYGGEGYLMGVDAAPFLRERIAMLKSMVPGNRAFDIACGEGRNSIFLARHGFAVTAVDISPVGIEKGIKRMEEEGVVIDFRVLDLEGYDFDASYDLIVNINFLLRDLVPKMVAALNPGGVILFDTILDTPSLVGHHTKSYLLKPGELNVLFGPLPGKILYCEEFPDGPAPTAKLIFQKKVR